MTVTNSVLWNNRRTASGIATDQVSGIATVSYSCVQDGEAGDASVFPGTGNIDLAPLFVEFRATAATGGMSATMTISGISGCFGSPCVNRGNNSAVPAGVTTDLAGNPRIAMGIVDLGAIERAPLLPGDFDGDGAEDDVDNCPLHSQRRQEDATVTTSEMSAMCAGRRPIQTRLTRTATGSVTRATTASGSTTRNQGNLDGDAFGDACDDDDDNDGQAGPVGQLPAGLQP